MFKLWAEALKGGLKNINGRRIGASAMFWDNIGWKGKILRKMIVKKKVKLSSHQRQTEFHIHQGLEALKKTPGFVENPDRQVITKEKLILTKRTT